MSSWLYLYGCLTSISYSNHCLRLLGTSRLRHLSLSSRTVVGDFNQCVVVVHALFKLLQAEASSDRSSSLLVVPTSLVKISTTDGPQLVLGRESSGGKRGWQTEGLEQLRIHERHDLLDQVTTQGKNADAVARERAGLLVPHVRRERRLAIC